MIIDWMPMNRTTYQKQSILKALQSMRGQHPTVDAICAEVAKNIPSISLATVYRVLNQYAEQGLVNRVHIPDSPTRYDDWLAPHHHLLCNSCKQLFDLPPLPLPELALPQDTEAGHTITGVELIFRGTCSGCAAKTS